MKSFEELRIVFEERVFLARFLKSIEKVPGKQFMKVECPSKDELCKKEEGIYVDSHIDAMWFGFLLSQNEYTKFI
jgi:hypothetical protein